MTVTGPSASIAHGEEVAPGRLGGRADNLLGDALGAPHDGGGAHRLVGGDEDEDEGFGGTGGGDLHQVGGAEDVVGDGLDEAPSEG